MERSEPQHRDNFLLNLLEPDVLDRIEPLLSIIDLHREQVLAETHQRIERVYFPHSGIISCVVELIGGGAIETGMMARMALSERAKHSMTRCRSIMS